MRKLSEKSVQKVSLLKHGAAAGNHEKCWSAEEHWHEDSEEVTMRRRDKRVAELCVV